MSRLTDEQIAFDFCQANPGKTVIVNNTIRDSAGVVKVSYTCKEERKTKMAEPMFHTKEDKLLFGKYKGMTVAEVIAENPQYLLWAHDTIEWFKLEESLHEDLVDLVCGAGEDEDGLDPLDPDRDLKF